MSGYTKAIRISHFPTHSSHTEEDSARTTRHVYHAFSCMRLSSRTAFRGICCAKSRLALSTRNCCHGMCDPHHSLVQRVRTSQLVGALLGAWVPAGPSASRRTRTQAGQTVPALGEQTVSVTQHQISGNGIWMWPEIIALVYLDRNLSQRYHFGHGSFSENFILAHSPSDPRRCNRGSPLTKSDWALPREGRTYQVFHHHVPFHCQLLKEARSPEDLLFAGRNISITLTVIRVRAALTSSVPAAFLAQSSAAANQGSNDREKEEELSGHTGRAIKRQRTGVDSSGLVFKMGMDQVERQDFFFLRFLLAERNVAHCCSTATSPISRACRAIYCRTDLLQRRGIAKSEWAILPIQEIAAYLWCSLCEHLGSGERSTAPRALAAHGGWVPWCRCAEKVDGLSSVRNQNTASGTSTWLEAIARVCPSLRFRFSPQHRSSRGSFCKSSSALAVTTECDWLSQGCRENRKRHLRSRRCQQLTAERQALNPPSTRNPSTSLAASGLRNEKKAVLPCRRQPNPEKWTLRSGAGVHAH